MKCPTFKTLIVGLFPAVALSVITYFRFNFFSQYEPLIAEDGLFEMLQFTFYCATSYFFVRSFKVANKKRQALWSIFAALAGAVFFLIALEEISWGQRIFNIKNPEYFQEHNIQYEISFHNLDTVQPFLHWAYLSAGIMLSFSGLAFTFFNKSKHTVAIIMQQMLPSVWLSFYFLPTTALYAILMFYKPFGIIMKNGVPFMLGRDQELVELFLTLGFAIHAYTVFEYYTTHLRTYRKNINVARYFLPSFFVR